MTKITTIIIDEEAKMTVRSRETAIAAKTPSDIEELFKSACRSKEGKNECAY